MNISIGKSKNSCFLEFGAELPISPLFSVQVICVAISAVASLFTYPWLKFLLKDDL